MRWIRARLGRTRGGLGTRRALRLTRGTASYSLLADGAIVPPVGILDGETGAPVGSDLCQSGANRPFPTPGKVVAAVLSPMMFARFKCRSRPRSVVGLTA